ncbi:MAG: hypothetical protein KAV00_05850 [Phycisphaerae bacterium]|nr:hypothetical protein [Phycisphaerae bacterium]
MDIGKTFFPYVLIFLLVVFLTVPVSVPVHAGEVLLEGFEKPDSLKTSGKVSPVKGVDAVTEGVGALQLSPGAKVTIQVPAGAISKVGWLKIDTFEVRPVMASLNVSFGKILLRRGYVSPGTDTLAVPLGLVARTHRGAWPEKPLTVKLHNPGQHPVVIDNVRLATPAVPPGGVILLDFGPPNQVLWPGFEPAGAEGTSIAWSGANEILSYTNRYPDPLMGDFTGRQLGYKQLEAITLRSEGQSTAWVWMTHYARDFSSPAEYSAKMNRKSILRRRFSLGQMLSPDGLLRGKDQPWTIEWFDKSFVPSVVSGVECSLKADKNRLELLNCQLAAVIISPRKSQNATRAYVKQLEQDILRYRRQFVLATQHHTRCNVTPTPEETKGGCIVFSPPRNDWFNRMHVPKAEHRAGILKLTVASGSSAIAAIAAVPCKDGKMLSLRIDALRDPGKPAVPSGRWELYALNTMPVVENACVHYQPFLPVRNFRNVSAGGVYWFILRAEVPGRTRTGIYKGTVHITLDRTRTQIPVELEVVNIGSDRAERKRTFAVMKTGDCAEAYYSLAHILPVQHRNKVTKDILTRLYDAGFNAAIVNGPTMTRTLKLQPTPMINNLQKYPRPGRSGRMLVNLSSVHWMLQFCRVQPGTARYTNKTHDTVKMCNDIAGKNKFTDYSLYCGHGQSEKSLSEVAKRTLTVRRTKGGAPAISTLASSLSSMESGQRAKLLSALETLICVPNHKDLGSIGEKFKKTGRSKIFAIRISYPDVYTGGFYCWGVGADGAYISRIFGYRPLFNAFFFDPRNLLLPARKGDFEPTLGLLKFQQSVADYDLACRCEALVRKAKEKSKDASSLEKILMEIRITADSKPPRYNGRLMRATSVPPEQLQTWRTSLIREAGKVYEEMTKAPR